MFYFVYFCSTFSHIDIPSQHIDMFLKDIDMFICSNILLWYFSVTILQNIKHIDMSLQDIDMFIYKSQLHSWIREKASSNFLELAPNNQTTLELVSKALTKLQQLLQRLVFLSNVLIDWRSNRNLFMKKKKLQFRYTTADNKWYTNRAWTESN